MQYRWAALGSNRRVLWGPNLGHYRWAALVRDLKWGVGRVTAPKLGHYRWAALGTNPRAGGGGRSQTGDITGGQLWGETQSGVGGGNGYLFRDYRGGSSWEKPSGVGWGGGREEGS